MSDTTRMVRWMLVALAYGAIVYVPLFAVAIINPGLSLPDWTPALSGLAGFVLGSLGPLRHIDWIYGDRW